MQGTNFTKILELKGYCFKIICTLTNLKPRKKALAIFYLPYFEFLLFIYENLKKRVLVRLIFLLLIDKLYQPEKN